MLRIQIDDQATVATFYIQGKLVGNCVDELRKAWAATRKENPQKQTVIELTSLLVVDASARKLLRQMHMEGAQLAGNGLMCKTLIADIVDGKSVRPDSAFLITTKS